MKYKLHFKWNCFHIIIIISNLHKSAVNGFLINNRNRYNLTRYVPTDTYRRRKGVQYTLDLVAFAHLIYPTTLHHKLGACRIYCHNNPINSVRLWTWCGRVGSCALILALWGRNDPAKVFAGIIVWNVRAIEG